jgi:cleavage stimulation factor subunit 2
LTPSSEPLATDAALQTTSGTNPTHPDNKDRETAASAVRNLNNVEVGGRPLRIDLADSDPFLEGKTTVRGEIIEVGRDDHHKDRDRDTSSRPQDSRHFLSALPPGLSVPLGSTSLDMISQTLAAMDPKELMEILAQTKACFLCSIDH